MLAYVLPVLFTLFIWWFSTGAILYLDSLPQRTYRWSLLGATAALIWTLSAIDASAEQTSVASAYQAFACGILTWGWVEMSFLMGFITGPRTSPCPADSTGWRRALHALEAILYHELALIAALIVIAGLSWAAPNQLSLETFLILWVLRVSAKLNVFLGVPNLGENLLPEHLRYLQTYFTRKRMNLLFPFAVTAATIAATWLWRATLAASDDFRATSLCFLATLLTLAVLEHWFMVLPIPADALWRWGSNSRQKIAAASEPLPRVVSTPTG